MSGLCEYEPSQEQGFLKVKFYIASASRRSWYERGVKAGSKQDPKTFKSSSNLGIKVQFNRRKLLVRSSFLFWVRFLRQDRKSGFLNISLLAVSSRSKLDLRETRLLVTVGAPSVEESCSQAVVMSSFLFRFRRGNSFSCTTGLNNLFF